MKHHINGAHRIVTICSIGNGGGWYSITDERHSIMRVVRGRTEATRIAQQIADTPYPEPRINTDPYLKFIKYG